MAMEINDTYVLYLLVGFFLGYMTGIVVSKPGEALEQPESDEKAEERSDRTAQK